MLNSLNLLLSPARYLTQFFKLKNINLLTKIEKHTKIKQLGNSPINFIYTQVDFDSENKKIHNFCVIQFYEKNNKRIEVIKIDSSHGRIHMHNYYTSEYLIKEIKFDSLLEAFNYAKAQIQKNWQYYLEAFKKKDLK